MTGLTEAWMEVLVGETLRVQGPVEAGGPVVGGAGAGRLYRRRRGRGEPQLDRKENKSREEKHIVHQTTGSEPAPAEPLRLTEAEKTSRWICSSTDEERGSAVSDESQLAEKQRTDQDAPGRRRITLKLF